MSRTEVRRLRRVAARDRVCAAGAFWSPGGGVLVDVFGVASTGAPSSPIAPLAPAPAPSSEDRRALGLTCPLRRRSEVRAADLAGGGDGGAGCSSASTARTLLSSSARVFSSSATTCCAKRYKHRGQMSFLFCCCLLRHLLANNFSLIQGRELDYWRNEESM